MAQFEEADSCVQIIDQAYFYSALTSALNGRSRVTFRGVHEVVYQDRDEEWNGIDWGRSPVVIKGRKFLPQAERWHVWGYFGVCGWSRSNGINVLRA